MFVSKHQKDWDVFIAAALFAFRTSPSDSTGETPLYLLFGREARLPMEVSLLPPEDPTNSIIEHRRRIVKSIEIVQQIARENIALAQQKMKEYYDLSAKDPEFVKGSKVWVCVPKTYNGLSRKLLRKYHGPYRVEEKLSPVHFRLRTCSNKPVTSIVHANRMELFVDPRDRPIEPPSACVDNFCFSETDLPSDSFKTSSTPTVPPNTSSGPTPVEHVLSTQPTTDTTSIHDNPTPVSSPTDTVQDATSRSLIDDQTVFNDERLLDSRLCNGETQYLVRWITRLEPASNILDPRLLEDFHPTKA